jgi:hypothetical protein
VPSDPVTTDVTFDVRIDGRFVTDVPLSADALARARAADVAPDPAPAARRRAVVAELPPRGPLRLVVDLRTPSPPGPPAGRPG